MEILVSDNIKKRHMTERTVLFLLSADQWKFTNLPNLLMKCCADVYSVEETSLFYCATLDASLS
jgi:hypothetical protein